MLAVMAGTEVSADTVIVFDDDFTGNSGGTPAGWTVFIDNGAVVESGSVVSITGGTEDPTLLTSSATINPQGVETTLRLEIDSLTDPGAVLSGLLDSSWGGGMFMVGLVNGEIQVVAAGAGSGSDAFAYASSWTSGPAVIEVTIDSDSFRITSDIDSYDSGDQLYATALPDANFALTDLTSSTMPMMYAFDGTTEIDRITVTTSDVPEPATMAILGIGGFGALLRRRRRNQR
jgi:hypothetical protein